MWHVSLCVLHLFMERIEIETQYAPATSNPDTHTHTSYHIRTHSETGHTDQIKSSFINTANVRDGMKHNVVYRKIQFKSMKIKAEIFTTVHNKQKIKTEE